MFKKLKPHFGKLGIILVAAIILLVGSDLLTKYLEEQFFWNAKIIPGFIEIKSGVHNPGCAFSFLDENPEIGQPVLITLTFLFLAVLIFGFIFMPNRFVIFKVAVTLLISGAVGNLYDRLFMPFYVRDWFGLNMFGNMAYCNFADFWIVIGAVLAIIDLMFLNEWAVFPLTKSAKAAQAKKKEEENANRLGENAAETEISEAEAETQSPEEKSLNEDKTYE